MNVDNSLKFVDLFSGLGGFHSALNGLGHKCVFASEIDEKLRNLYSVNFGMRPASDIRFSWKDVPKHNILCAGFPCQPFSKAGSQKGFDCSDSGDLFDYILKIIDRHSPEYLLFENVPNLIRHAQGQTWERIKNSLRVRGYTVDCRELSPNMFGVPQIRPRAIIVGAKNGLAGFEWPLADYDQSTLHVSSVLDKNPSEAEKLTPDYQRYLEVWEEFLHIIPKNSKMPSFPIWAMEFGADYPVEKRSPYSYDATYLARFKGAFGTSLKGSTKGQQLGLLPTYSQTKVGEFPRWKVRFILQNRDFYKEHQELLQPWLPKIKDFAPSFQKFEWNWQAGSRTIWDKLVQFRASGIRIKNPTTAPSLVALTSSQVPVVPWEMRYMTMKECARLQSMDNLPLLPSTKTQTYKALGNAVNVEVISRVAEKLICSKNVDINYLSGFASLDITAEAI